MTERRRTTETTRNVPNEEDRTGTDSGAGMSASASRSSRRTHGLPWLALGVIAILASAVPAPIARGESYPLAADEAEAPTGKELLSAAWAVKKRSFKKEAEEKRRILIEAVEAYRRVASAVPDDRQSCAIAAFRIGEIWRSLGDRTEAEAAFREAAAFEDVPDLRARALLELAHLDRREEKYDAAIRAYEDVGRLCPDERDRVAQAIVWIGKCHRKQKDYEPARAALRRVIDGYADQVSRLLEAYDLLASVYLEEGELRMAEEVLAECAARAEALEAAGDAAHAGLSARVAKLKAWKKVRAAREQADAEPNAEPRTEPRK